MSYQERVSLSKDDLRKLSVIGKYREGLYSREDAACKLNVSLRQFSRLVKKVREEGPGGIRHGNCGRTPWNKIPQELIDEYVDLYRDKYKKFNFAHALEMMAMLEKKRDLSYTRFRKACRQQGLGKVKKRRVSKARIARERYAEEGYMWQLDGSPHVWDGRESSTLIGLIDDATSMIPNAELHPSETTWACLNVMRRAIERYGRPEFVLTDMAGWSEGSGRKRVHFSQFERACLELDITVIATPTAESKGRIERLNRTFQDRLIPELGIFGIKGLKDCNRYLEQVFVPSWNEKFTVEARSPTNRYRPVDKHIDLREVFCLKERRIVNRDHTVSYKGKSYRLFPGEGHTYRGKEVMVHEYEDKTISIFYGSQKLESEERKVPKRRWENIA